MNIIQRSGILALGLLSLVLGCAQTDIDSADEVATDEGAIPEMHTLGKKGVVGHNGLPTDVYQDLAPELAIATGQGLVTSLVTHEITNTVLIADILSSPEGAHLFEYAIACALPKGFEVHYNGATYEGGGYLLETADWLTGPLAPAARSDLMECVVAHVNPKFEEVPILLSGLSVHDDGLDHSDFDVDEALWVINVGGVGLGRTQVWPLPSFTATCGADPEAALSYRVCGKDPVTCSLNVRTDLELACTVDLEGNYICDGMHALKTSLSTKSFPVLYDAALCPG